MPKVLKIKEAAPLLEVSEESVRQMIQNGLIAGAGCWKSTHGKGKNRTYYITDEQIKNFKRGNVTNE